MSKIIKMTPKEFKTKWLQGNSDTWCEFEENEVASLPVSSITKNWLRVGFAESAAPFLDFGIANYDGKFYSIAGYYEGFELNSNTEHSWILGSDGAGNPICIDSAKNDRIVLLDHELDFEIQSILNSNVAELALCLLEYRDFILKVQSECGEDAYMDAGYSRKHVLELKSKMEQIDPLLFTRCDFWNDEIQRLLDEIKI